MGTIQKLTGEVVSQYRFFGSMTSILGSTISVIISLRKASLNESKGKDNNSPERSGSRLGSRVSILPDTTGAHITNANQKRLCCSEFWFLVFFCVLGGFQNIELQRWIATKSTIAPALFSFLLVTSLFKYI